MKSIRIILVALFLSFGYSHNAQTHEASSEKRSDKEKSPNQIIKEKLKLTDEKKISYDEIIQKYVKEQRTVHTNKALSQEERITAGKDIWKKQDAEMKTILSEEQFKTYSEMQAERRLRVETTRNQKSSAQKNAAAPESNQPVPEKK